MIRKYPLVTREVYHVMNKSIEGYQIFNRPEDYGRMVRLLRYFSLSQPPVKFSFFIERNPEVQRKGFETVVSNLVRRDGQLVQIMAYCLMPTHFHMMLRQVEDQGITLFLGRALNSYARYFNTKYKRKGTLWMSRFRNVLVESDEQCLHLTRYIHLNPVTAGLVKRVDDWCYSSFAEYVMRKKVSYPLTVSSDFLDMTGRQYRRFVENQADYQRKLAVIKHQILE